MTVTGCTTCGSPDGIPGWAWHWTLTPKIAQDIRYLKDCICTTCRKWAIHERMRLLTSDDNFLEKLIRSSASFQEYMAETKDIRMQHGEEPWERRRTLLRPYAEKMVSRNKAFGLLWSDTTSGWMSTATPGGRLKVAS